VNLIVNGKNKSFTGETVLDLIDSYGFESLNVVVELNNDILHRENYSIRTLVEGDKLEIVTFVGGG